MNWTSLDWWIVAAAALSAMSCALLGNFLVLRRMSMMGDAISHAVLPGLAVAFLITGSRGSIPMFIGAAIVGVLTAAFTEWIHRFGKVEESAAMGVVFTVLFALGLILLVRAADHVDLDPGCVLYGAIELTPLDMRNVWGFEVPRAVIMLTVMLLFNLLFTSAFYKELRITAFDPGLATTLGFNSTLMHYLLIVVVAMTTVAAFESVGSILVIAMLIVPASAAHLITDKYGMMLIVSVIFGAVAAVGGHVAAITVPTWFGYADTSTAGMMAVVAGLLFTLALIFAPRHGIISRLYQQLKLSVRIIAEDVLGILYRWEELAISPRNVAMSRLVSDATGCRTWMARVAMLFLSRRGRIERSEGQWCLTESGRLAASQVLRGHRLWESYLARHAAIATDHLHASAERTEHYLTDTMRAALADDVQHANHDPQGRPIPESRKME